MNSYTPGPWHYEIVPNSWYASVTQYRIYSGPRHDPEKIIAGTLDEDHARLIAAAPALVDALRRLLAVRADAFSTRQEWAAAWEQARAALAAAGVEV